MCDFVMIIYKHIPIHEYLHICVKSHYSESNKIQLKLA